MTSDDRLVLALPKGRITDEVAPLLRAAGVAIPDLAARPRTLRFDDADLGMRILVLRGHDVPAYVHAGAAHVGVAGLDVLLEHERPLYAPLDLGVGLCWMSVIAERRSDGATPALLEPMGRPLRVATKFPSIARRHLEQKGLTVETIALHGNIELAPSCGLADCVVDLVSTGETLRRNGLVEIDRFLRVTSRLICNRAAMRLEHRRVRPFIRAMRAAVDAQSAAHPCAPWPAGR